jgi:ASC-1-like (ASCH) protein
MSQAQVEQRKFELKIHPEFFERVVDGSKKFEIRKEDDILRMYREGDLINLREWDPKTKDFTGKSTLVEVAYLTRDPRFVKEGHVVMSIERVN